MKRRHFGISALIVLIIFFVTPLVFPFPNFINYQGKLTDSTNNILNGDYLLTFKIYSVETEGEPLWTEKQTVTVNNGIYNVELGDVNPFPADLFETEMLYLEVLILNPDTGMDEPLSPRMPFSSTGFSMKAKDAYTAGNADTVDGFHAEDFASTGHTHSFSELTGTANDDQIPNEITIDFAAKAGDADKLDGKDSREFGDGHSLDAADGSSTDVVYVDNEGKVGIGTTNPFAKLDVDGAFYIGSHLTGGQGIRVEGTEIEAVGSAMWQNLYLNGSGVSGHEGGNVVLQKDGGNVGIGTEAPSEKLEINGNLIFTEEGVTRSIYVEKSDGIDEPGRDLEIYAGECNAQMIETMRGGNLRLHGGRGYWPSGGDVYVYGGDTGDDNDPEKLGNVILAHNGKVSGGNVGIGTTSPSHKLHVIGNAMANNWYTPSDYRLKKNITKIDRALDKVSGLRGVEFEWRTEEYSHKNLDERRNLGLIAQEVENILPETVYTDREGYKSLDYASIVPLLIEAVKELKTQNEDLQLRIKALERDRN